jgi:micrococcal nuclease
VSDPRRRLALVVAAAVVLAGCGAGGGLVDGDAATATATAHPAAAPSTEALVTEVIDGDTVRVRFDDGRVETVRLLGVDAPETRAASTPEEFEGVPATEAGRRCLRAAGERATAFAVDRLAGERVGLGFDPESDRRGGFGRLLAYVYVDGRAINLALLARGHARLYEGPFVEASRYAAGERAARRDGRGLWGCVEPSTTVGGDGPRLHVHPDPPGDDNEVLGRECVAVTNAGDGSLGLAGWTVEDEAGHRYEFPPTTLGPGETVIVHTGAGADRPGHRYWGRAGAVWNNDGDAATLRDRSGARRAVVGYRRPSEAAWPHAACAG